MSKNYIKNKNNDRKDKKDFTENYDNTNIDYIIGRHSVKDYIKAKKNINKIYVEKNATGSIFEIISLAKENKIPIVYKDKAFFDRIGRSHQGIAAQIAPFEYSSLDEILDKKDKPIVLILDQIEDVNNLGAIIRTAECAKIDGIIIPKRHQAQITPTVSKISQGALSNIKICQVNNLSDTILKLKEKGLWIVGTSLEESNDYNDQDYDMPLAIIVGNEQKGISKKVLEKCDFRVKIPIYGNTQSLNVSVATGIILYKAIEKRLK